MGNTPQSSKKGDQTEHGTCKSCDFNLKKFIT
jgi:hypothetical protein